MSRYRILTLQSERYLKGAHKPSTHYANLGTLQTTKAPSLRRALQDTIRARLQRGKLHADTIRFHSSIRRLLYRLCYVYHRERAQSEWNREVKQYPELSMQLTSDAASVCLLPPASLYPLSPASLCLLPPCSLPSSPQQCAAPPLP